MEPRPEMKEKGRFRGCPLLANSSTSRGNEPKAGGAGAGERGAAWSRSAAGLGGGERGRGGGDRVSSPEALMNALKAQVHICRVDVKTCSMIDRRAAVLSHEPPQTESISRAGQNQIPTLPRTAKCPPQPLT